MPADSRALEVLLARDFLSKRPADAAAQLETVPATDAAELLTRIEPHVAADVFRRLTPAHAIDILAAAGTSGGALLHGMRPTQAGAVLSGLSEEARSAVLAGLSGIEGREIRRLLEYPPETAGRYMDPRIAVFRPTTTVGDALARLRETHAGRHLLTLYLVDEEGRLCGAVPLHEVALAEPAVRLLDISRQATAAVSPFLARSEVVEALERHGLVSIPVVDSANAPIGVLRLNELMPEVGRELSADLVSVTGASKEEGALSSATFAVRKRLPWLQVNLATAFSAAAVVAIFEDTIAQFTALAVLLPVVAGQSGNTGSQALAVVLRGLALREITLRQWPAVAAKELAAGVLNGLGVGLVTCAGVYIWSGSVGLVLVIGIAMLLSMAVAGVTGALIPVLLAAVGLDPAQSSSIILTTVTDIVGFVSFLGLATALAPMI